MTNEPLVLVGNGAGGTITAARLTADALQPLLTTSIGNGCSTFAVDADRDLVYSATKEPTPAIVTLRLDRNTGALEEIARHDVPDSLTYLTLTRGGTVLLGASYAGGWGAVWPISEGTIGEASARIDYANLHCVITDAAGLHAYFVSLGADLIAQYDLDAAGGLRPLSPSTVAAPEGAGPRHLILNTEETNAYLITEYSGEVIRFTRDATTGALTRGEALSVFDPTIGLQHSRFGADPKAEHLIWGADLHLARQERYLLASERSGSTVATVELDEGGVLGRVVAWWATQQQPRGFGVAPDQIAVVVAGEASGAVELGVVNTDGSVTSVQEVPTGAGANWVRFV